MAVLERLCVAGRNRALYKFLNEVKSEDLLVFISLCSSTCNIMGGVAEKSLLNASANGQVINCNFLSLSVF